MVIKYYFIFLLGENSQSGINSTSFGSTDPDNIRKDYCDLRVRVPESVTTDGEGNFKYFTK